MAALFVYDRGEMHVPYIMRKGAKRAFLDKGGLKGQKVFCLRCICMSL